MRELAALALAVALALSTGACGCRNAVGDCNARPSSTERPLQTGRQQP